MHRTESSLRQADQKKAPLNRLIKAAHATNSRRFREAKLPTLDILRNTLLSGQSPNEVETDTWPSHRFRDLFERAANRIG